MLSDRDLDSLIGPPAGPECGDCSEYCERMWAELMPLVSPEPWPPAGTDVAAAEAAYLAEFGEPVPF